MTSGKRRAPSSDRFLIYRSIESVWLFFFLTLTFSLNLSKHFAGSQDYFSRQDQDRNFKAVRVRIAARFQDRLTENTDGVKLKTVGDPRGSVSLGTLEGGIISKDHLKGMLAGSLEFESLLKYQV